MSWGLEKRGESGREYRQQGKGYVIQDGDVISFKFNVTPKGK